jgi:muramoyltetrapeptide carboxypeptidase
MLPPSARVGVFAPSHRFDPDRFERGLALLRAAGHEPVLGPNLNRAHRYFAGTDAERLADLVWALTDPSLDAAMMVRGGSGLGRLLPLLPEQGLVRGVHGFSDGTALHVALWQRHGLQGVHGPVVHSLESQGWGDFADMQGQGTGRAEGPVVGGNLCVLTSLCGTADALQAEGCILLLEDIGEPAYKVDRMLNQLRLSGCLEGVVGVALGEFGEVEGLLDILREHVDVPLAWGLPVGHGDRNVPWRYGARAVLDRGLRWS